MPTDHVLQKMVYFAIQKLLVAKDPTFLLRHVRDGGFREFIPAHDDTVGGYKAFFRCEAWCGELKIEKKTNGKYRMIFGRYPKNPSTGKNEYKIDFTHDDVEEDMVVSTIQKYDDKSLVIPGVITSNQLKKRPRIKL